MAEYCDANQSLPKRGRTARSRRSQTCTFQRQQRSVDQALHACREETVQSPGVVPAGAPCSTYRASAGSLRWNTSEQRAVGPWRLQCKPWIASNRKGWTSLYWWSGIHCILVLKLGLLQVLPSRPPASSCAHSGRSYTVQRERERGEVLDLLQPFQRLATFKEPFISAKAFCFGPPRHLEPPSSAETLPSGPPSSAETLPSGPPSSEETFPSGPPSSAETLPSGPPSSEEIFPPGALPTMSQTEVSTCSIPHTQRVFQEAVRKGNTKELQSLLQNMTNCEFNVNSFGPEGQTALHQSVIDGNLELVKLLVKFGADIRLANRDGWSALHIAAYGGHQDIVLYLITKAKYSSSSR